MALLDDVLAIPDHLGDALWRVDSARLSPAPSAGLLVCGMGGSAIGLLFAVQSLGSALGPITCGLIADRYGLMATFYFLVGTIIVANLFIFFTPPLTNGAKASFAQQPAE